MIKRFVVAMLVCFVSNVDAATAASSTGMSATSGMLKMLIGLAVVLAFIALISWGVKRLLPGASAAQSAIRVVGGVSVGSRERVLVLEVADRWLVVGVAPGQVNSIANLAIGETQVIPKFSNETNQTIHPMVQPLVKSFADFLSKSTKKMQHHPQEKS